jgi:hypothetical protein
VKGNVTDLLFILVLGSGSRGGEKMDFLLLLGLRTILVEQLEKLSGRVLVESMGEL